MKFRVKEGATREGGKFVATIDERQTRTLLQQMKMPDTIKLFIAKHDFFTCEYPVELFFLEGEQYMRLFSLLEFGGRVSEVEEFGGDVIMVEFDSYEHLMECAKNAQSKSCIVR